MGSLPWGQVPGSNNRAMAARYLSPGMSAQSQEQSKYTNPYMDDYFHISCNSFGILIHSFILLNQSHKLFESLHPIGVKFPCIVKLTLLLHPIQHIMLL